MLGKVHMCSTPCFRISVTFQLKQIRCSTDSGHVDRTLKVDGQPLPLSSLSSFRYESVRRLSQTVLIDCTHSFQDAPPPPPPQQQQQQNNNTCLRLFNYPGPRLKTNGQDHCLKTDVDLQSPTYLLPLLQTLRCRTAEGFFHKRESPIFPIALW